jgi:DNA-binding XRE family transcriptional regulator
VRPSQTPQVALGRAIGLRRREVELTQEALADSSGVDETTIRGIEGGRANPTWHVVDRIARALGWPLWLLAKLADELETADRRPTDGPLRPIAERTRPAALEQQGRATPPFSPRSPRGA